MAPRPEIAVIGAGAVGLMSADALLERGEKVAVYESGRPGQGQSAGVSRLFRHAHDDPRLVALAIESRELWRGLESRFGQELISRDGVVAVGEAWLERLGRLGEMGIPARRIGPDEIRERQPLLAEYAGDAVFDETAGAIRTQTAIKLLAGRLGEGLIPGEVISVRPTGRDTVELRTPAGAFEHPRAILCAGRGTAQLARGAGVEVPIALGCHVRATFELVGEPPARLACFQDAAGEWGETGVYAAPAPGNQRYSVGLAETMEVRDDGTVIDPAEFAEHERRVKAYVSRALPGLQPDPFELLHCWVTELPWHEDAFAVWEHDGLLVAGGHNLWKMAPVLGEALAEGISGGELREELRPGSRLGET